VLQLLLLQSLQDLKLNMRWLLHPLQLRPLRQLQQQLLLLWAEALLAA
jgi:hypothetical protein